MCVCVCACDSLCLPLSHTAPSDYQISLPGNQYHCYTLTHEPFTSSHDDLSIQLPSPLPSSGTIVTGQSADRTDTFTLYLDGNILHYELIIGEREFAPKSTLELSTDQTYRISLTRSPEDITILIQTVSSTNQIAVAETIRMSLSPGTAEPVFPFLCAGGGALEHQLYEGVMERLMAGHIAVFEMRNSTISTPSDFISFHDNPTSPSLFFRKLGLSSDDEFSFQFRLGTDISSGILLQTGNASFMVTVTIYPDVRSDIILFAGPDVVECENIIVTDNNWHTFEMRKTEVGGRRGLIVLFDHDTSNACRLNSTEVHDNIAVLESESSRLHIGPTTSNSDPSGMPISLVGCFQKIRFKTGSREFAPNLEVPIASYERFSGDGCRGCDQEYEAMLCKKNKGVCRYNGYQNITCECFEPFTGPTCEGVCVCVCVCV